MRVWDASPTSETYGKCVLGPLEGHEGTVNSVSFSPDGKRIVSGSNDRTVRVWDAVSGQCVFGQDPWRCPRHIYGVMSVSFSPDSARIVSVSRGKADVMVWDAVSGKRLLGPLELGCIVHSVSFSRDGKRIVAGEWDNTWRVWDAVTGQRLALVWSHTPDDGEPTTRIVSRYGTFSHGPTIRIVSGPWGNIVSKSWGKTMRDWDAVWGQ